MAFAGTPRMELPAGRVKGSRGTESEDLQFFEHGHPRLAADGLFQYPIVFPRTGMYRVLSDFYPVGATPQLTTETLFVPGPSPAPVRLARDYSAKVDRNMQVSMITIPERVGEHHALRRAGRHPGSRRGVAREYSQLQWIATDS